MIVGLVIILTFDKIVALKIVIFFDKIYISEWLENRKYSYKYAHVSETICGITSNFRRIFSNNKSILTNKAS